jgi:hypothetical protein
MRRTDRRVPARSCARFERGTILERASLGSASACESDRPCLDGVRMNDHGGRVVFAGGTHGFIPSEFTKWMSPAWLAAFTAWSLQTSRMAIAPLDNTCWPPYSLPLANWVFCPSPESRTSCIPRILLYLWICSPLVVREHGVVRAKPAALCLCGTRTPPCSPTAAGSGHGGDGRVRAPPSESGCPLRVARPGFLYLAYALFCFDLWREIDIR